MARSCTVGTHSPVRVGIVVFDGADELDIVGPHAVLSTWAGRAAPRPDVALVSRDGEPVRSSTGMDLVPTAPPAELEHLHVLIHPGGPGARRLARDPQYLGWLRRQRQHTPALAAVGAGCLPLAAAGLLAGRAVAVHPDLVAELLAVEPGALVDTSVSQVDDGDLLTCAAGGHAVDLALHLVERLDSVAACVQVRRRLHFEPAAEPPTYW